MAARDDTSYLQLSDETKTYMSRYLRSIDTDETGIINPDQLADFVRVLGFYPTEADLKWLIEHFDTNKNGKLEIPELIENLHVLNAHSLNGDDIMAAFKVFDLDGDGFIRCNELVKALTYKNGFSVKEARQLTDHLIRTYDRNNDGKLNYSEFVEIFMSMQYPFLSDEGGTKADNKTELTAHDREQMLKEELAN